jgi:hypothetical protein
VAPPLLCRISVDLHETKERVAVALVEAIFRRAGYGLRRFSCEVISRLAPDEFTPSFQASGPNGQGSKGEFPVGVFYRPFLEGYIALENQRRQSSIFTLARRQWPGLRLVLVTDHPEPGRSCFQALVGDEPGSTIKTVDLAGLPELAILPHDAADYEDLLVRIFGALSADRHRRPLVPAV